MLWGCCHDHQSVLSLVQFVLQSLQKLFAVDDVVRQPDAEGMFSGHVVQQRRPEHREVEAEQHIDIMLLTHCDTRVQILLYGDVTSVADFSVFMEFVNNQNVEKQTF